MSLLLSFAGARQLSVAPLPAAPATQPPLDSTAAVYHAIQGQTEVRMGRPSAAVVEIDGQLNEPVWQSAALLTGFSLYSPTDGRPAPDSTEVRVWYSSSVIYFGVRAYEPHGIVRATLADRDRVNTDDNIEIHLDPYQERRRAFVFIVNPLGIQADGTKAEGGGNISGSNVMPGQNDLSADFLWTSRGHVEDWGYEVEIRIPLASLRFPTRSVQRRGIQFSRKVQHSGYEETWTPVRRSAAAFIAQEGWLAGMTGRTRGVDALFNPELTSTNSGSSSTNPSNLKDWRYTRR